MPAILTRKRRKKMPARGRIASTHPSGWPIVIAAPRGRIQFDFILDGIRYRPSIKRTPSEANLRRPRERLEAIKLQIDQGTFYLEEEFPDYRYLHRVTGTSRVRLCNEVFDEYLAHCEARLRRGDMAAATVRTYRKVLSGIWRPSIGELFFFNVRYSRLVAIADKQKWNKKTYNNGISVLRRAFDFGYRDRPLEENPARCLRGARLRKADRPKVDPFCMHDAETFIELNTSIFASLRHASIHAGHAPARRWRKTLRSLHLRYRRPYVARHSSVSWNLMAGKNLLWVAKQHGHSLITMLRTYAAWAEGAVETDIQAIERSMKLTPREAPLDRPIARCRYGRRAASNNPRR